MEFPELIEKYTQALSCQFEDYVMDSNWFVFEWAFKNSENMEKLLRGDYKKKQNRSNGMPPLSDPIWDQKVIVPAFSDGAFPARMIVNGGRDQREVWSHMRKES